MDRCRPFAHPFALMALLGAGMGMGCTASPETPGSLGEVQQAFRECPEDTCGSNSPKIETQGFHELSLKGLPNAQQMKLTGAVLRGMSVSLSVQNGQLLVPGGKARLPLRGAQLIGLVLLLDAKIRDVPQRYELEIVGYRDLPYPVPAGSKDWTGAYIVEYVDTEGARRNLCAPRSGGSADLPYDESFGQLATEAVFFEGDRVDTERMTIDPRVDLDWFNIGCAGHTLAKLHLTRNSTASRAAQHGHSHPDRQATLKMFVADYCGTGKPFTVAGQPLSWSDGGVMPFYGEPFSLEARWTMDGAACLDEPRMLYPATEEGAIKFKEIKRLVAAECPQLSTCLDHDFFFFDGRPRVSANRTF
jgi:ADYC domain